VPRKATRRIGVSSVTVVTTAKSIVLRYVSVSIRPIGDDDYRRLLLLRTGLRRFLHWSEQQAEDVGLTGMQHQLLLAIRGHPDPRGPTIGDVASYLVIKHHSAGELVDRAQAAGFLRRVGDPVDLRVVRLRLTLLGSRRLSSLTRLHLEELARLARQINPTLQGLDTEDVEPRS
jgi:DNA-binding MarR family transcriptional regulator